MQSLAISQNRRFLVHEDGTPFFYLGDSPWDIAYRLNREEIKRYLKDRADKRFTVVMVMGLPDVGKLERPNAEGHLPFAGKDPTKPNDKFFDYIEYILDEAEAVGLRVAFLPCWGDHVGPLLWGWNPQILNPKNAPVYGEYLGKRFADKKGLIWVIGGDRPVVTDEQYETWRALAKGIKQGDCGRHLMSFHPMGTYDDKDPADGPRNSSKYWQDDEWLDFNMIQTGHEFRNESVYTTIESDYLKQPVKPTMETEYCYENHLENWKPDALRFDDYDSRKGAYWSIFAGGHGFCYGCNDIYGFYTGPDGYEYFDQYLPSVHWQHALNMPGARQMQYVRALIESRPFLTRIPDQSLLRSPAGRAGEHVRATRDEHGRYAFVYCVTGKPVAIWTRKLSGSTLNAWWYDPRIGMSFAIGEFPRADSLEFTPPSSGYGHDWILVLDDATQNWPAPGA